MGDFEEKINNKEMLNDFLNKYFPPETSGMDEAEAETVEIKREELEKIIATGETIESLLNRIKERGYIFHGSPNDIKKLEARQANDVKGTKDNILKAVYATNIPEIAEFHALLNKRKGKTFYARWETGKNSQGELTIKFMVNRETLDNMSDGYVYVLKEKDFRRSRKKSSQFSKEEDYTPTYKIPVKKENLEHKIEIIKDGEVLKIIEKRSK